MNKNKMTILFGIILIIIGLVFVISPKGVFESIVLFVGITVIVYSVCSILVSVFGKNSTNFQRTGADGKKKTIGLVYGGSGSAAPPDVQRTRRAYPYPPS